MSPNIAPDTRLRIRIDLGTKLSRQNVSSPAPAKKERRKLSTLDFGNIRIPYGKYKSGKVSYWQLFYRDGGRRIVETRVSFKKLEARAQEIAIAMANGQLAMSQFTEDQRAHYRQCCKMAAEVSAPIEVLIREAIETRKKAARSNFVHKTCPQILEELLAAKKSENAGVRWIDDLDGRLTKFTTDFTGPLADLRPEDFELWLTRLNLSPRSFNNYRTALVAMVAFAREKKYLPAEWNELAPVKPKTIVKPDEEEIYSPEEIRSLLFTAEKCYPQHLPTLAIMAFAGCRHCELRDAEAALDWKDVHFRTRHIHISKAVAKNNTGRRHVPMQPNLIAWLEMYARPRGPVCTVSNLTNALARVAEKAGITWKQNALRNSFISYRCAVTQNVTQVAAEAGNSVSEIHKSYRKEIIQEEGQAWFDIMPTRSEALPLFAHAGL